MMYGSLINRNCWQIAVLEGKLITLGVLLLENNHLLGANSDTAISQHSEVDCFHLTAPCKSMKVLCDCSYTVCSLACFSFRFQTNNGPKFQHPPPPHMKPICGDLSLCGGFFPLHLN